LNRLLNQLDFPRLYNYYNIAATDQPECELEITYDHGKKKRIDDRGMSGTLGLEVLYQLLWDLHQIRPPDLPLPYRLPSNNPSGNTTFTSRLRWSTLRNVFSCTGINASLPSRSIRHNTWCGCSITSRISPRSRPPSTNRNPTIEI